MLKENFSMQRLALSMPIAIALALGNRYVLIKLWGLIATAQLNYGFAQWYFTHLHDVVSLRIFDIVSSPLLSVLLCIPLAYLATKLLKTRLWLHVAVMAAAPDFLDVAQVIFEDESPPPFMLDFAQSVALNLLVFPAAVVLYQYLNLVLRVHRKNAYAGV